VPKVVDHEQRRRELAAAVWRVIVREGVADVSIRSVAAESGWSSGALRHYFSTRAELLAFACDHVIDQVSGRIAALRPTGGPVEAVRAVLLETMPVDGNRRTEAAIAFSFLVLGLGDPQLARVQRRHFTEMHGLCLRLVHALAEQAALDPEAEDLPDLARRLHAVVDGLSVQALAGHLTADEVVRELDRYLATLTDLPRRAAHRAPRRTR
jgi:AcrR family transcriptional regulator